MVTIVTHPHPVLREVAQAVPLDDIASPDIAAIIADMKAALAKEKNGVAIAAPQIGMSLQIFVVAGHVYAMRAGEEYNPAQHPDRAFINPEIVSVSKKHAPMHEGCLSIRGEGDIMVWGDVPRAEKIKIIAYDERGKKHTVGASGFLSQIFQHEIDHLNGILYIDKALGVYEDETAEPPHE